MYERMHEKISVISFYNRDSGEVSPVKIKWQGTIHDVEKIGFHHTVREGRSLHHIFSVIASSLFFRLNLDTETLHWTVEEVSDGVPS